MKTIKEWFDELPQPYRFEAINNVINQKGAKRLLSTEKTLSDALITTFFWRDTPEGDIYWRKLFLIIREEERKKISDENN